MESARQASNAAFSTRTKSRSGLAAASAARAAGDIRAHAAASSCQVAVGAEQEHAAVPVVAALCQERAAARARSGFSMKRSMATGHIADGRGLLDVAVAGLGGRWARCRRSPACPPAPPAWRRCTAAWKAGDVADHVIGRQHQQQRFGAGLQRGQRDGRRGVAADWVRG